jgi:hypothetical protein
MTYPTVWLLLFTLTAPSGNSGTLYGIYQTQAVCQHDLQYMTEHENAKKDGYDLTGVGSCREVTELSEATDFNAH